MEYAQVQFLQSLRGAQALVLLAYLIVRRALTVKELRGFTGLSDDALRPALDSLASKGLLLKQTGQHGRVVWLPAGDTFFGHVFQNPVKPDSGGSCSSSSNITALVLTIEEEQEEEGQNPVKPERRLAESTFERNPFSDNTPEQVQANLAACDAAGIREPKRSAIANERGVTPMAIKAHVRQASAEGHLIGTAIYRLLHGWSYDRIYETEPVTRASYLDVLRARSDDDEES
jgi:hypothetical protein